MSSSTAIERPGRWDVPFAADMTEAIVERLLLEEPFSRLDKSRFPTSTPLAGILANDTRLIEAASGELLVREGDYGSSAFLVLRGSVRVAIDPLPAALLGRREPQRGSLVRALATLWSQHREPEVRALRRGAQPLATAAPRVALQDVPGILDRQRTVVLGAGEIFGELAALGRTPRTASVFAEGPAQLLEIRWQGLRDIRRADPGFRAFIDERYRERSLAVQLAETELFATLGAEQLQQVADATEFETYGGFDWYGSYKQWLARGEAAGTESEPLIAREGDYPNGLLVVRAGFARLTRQVGAGEQTIGYLGKGQLFGWEELLAGRAGAAVPLRASLRALGYVDVLRIPTAAVERVLAPARPAASVRPPAPASISPRLQAARSGFIEQRFINGTATMLIDMQVCTRCDDCVRACATTHDGNPRFLRQGPQIEGFMVAGACMHCVDPVCMIGCPTGAIHRTTLGGQVVINDDTCIGCGTCSASCPYDAIRMVEARTATGATIVDQATGQTILKATKCDLCADQVGGPACQRACPHDALRRVDMQQLEAIAPWIDRR